MTIHILEGTISGLEDKVLQVIELLRGKAVIALLVPSFWERRSRDVVVEIHAKNRQDMLGNSNREHKCHHLGFMKDFLRLCFQSYFLLE